MKFDNAIKKALKTKPPKGNEDNITPPIQIQFLEGDKIISESEYSNLDFLSIIAGHEGVANFTGAKLILDDGKKSYTFTLDVDRFVSNKIKTGKPMK
ncbi:MAG: hypothetical protein IPL74_19465 [Bacteroidetes bacterium]|nr:hypothetical protein [Bacteroidota bacterium]